MVPQTGELGGHIFDYQNPQRVWAKGFVECLQRHRSCVFVSIVSRRHLHNAPRTTRLVKLTDLPFLRSCNETVTACAIGAML